MATELKLKEDIKKLEAGIKSKATPEKIKGKLKNQLAILNAELSALQKPAASKMSRAKQLRAKYKALYGVRFQGIDIEKDADIPAMRIGRRVSQGIKGNQYASKKQAKGNVYYEYRENRIDMKQPPKKYPKLEDGGMMAKGGMFEKPIPAVMDKYGNIKNEKILQQDLQYLKEAYEDKLVSKAEYDKSYDEINEQLKFLQKREQGGMMAKGGKTQGYDDREDERLAMKYGKIKSKYLNSTKARRDDARFEERMADGGMMADGGYMAVKYLPVGVSKRELNKKIKDWYIKNYPTDDLGQEINDRITFRGFWALTSQNYTPYEVLDVYDSVVRERVEEKVSAILSNQKMADGGYMAKCGELKEGDYVWNALGKKLIVNKVTDEEYYLTSFGQSSASPFSKKKVDGYIKSGEWSLKPKMADGGMMDDGGEVGEGFLIRDMREKLKSIFPDSFGFTVNSFETEDVIRNSHGLIPNSEESYYGLEDSQIGSKLFFPQYKRDHDIRFRIYQGGENTYFYFLLESENGDQYIGQFGFKDRGDVPSSYITRFIAFLMEQYGLPFDIKHSVMANGGMMTEGGAVNEDNMEMVVSQVKAIKHHAEELSKIITSSTPIEAWVVAKIERAETDLSDVTHYLDGLKMEHGGRVSSSQHRLNR